MEVRHPFDAARTKSRVLFADFLRQQGCSHRIISRDGTALAQADVVIQQWIETARELGRDIPTSRGRLRYA
jgi:hypothetical protein